VEYDGVSVLSDPDWLPLSKRGTAAMNVYMSYSPFEWFTLL